MISIQIIKCFLLNYSIIFEATKKWTRSLRNLVKVYGELSIMFEGRLK